MAGPGGARIAWLDPADGRAVKVGPAVSPLFGFSHNFHGAFSMPEDKGRTWVGWAGVAMLLLSLSGIWLWWPRGAFAKAFRWRRTPDTLLNLHHVVGFWISIPMAILSVTGILISFPQLGAAVFGAPQRSPEAQGPRQPGADGARARGEGERREGGEARRGGPGARVNLTPEQAVAAAMAAHPEAPRLVAVSMPGAGRGPAGGQRAWRVDLRGQGEPVAVRVDDASASVADAPPLQRPPSAQGANRMVHEGGGSLIWKWIVSLAGIAPTLLALSGVTAWVRMELRKARQRRETTAAA